MSFPWDGRSVGAQNSGRQQRPRETARDLRDPETARDRDSDAETERPERPRIRDAETTKNQQQTTESPARKLLRYLETP